MMPGKEEIVKEMNTSGYEDRRRKSSPPLINTCVYMVKGKKKIQVFN